VNKNDAKRKGYGGENEVEMREGNEEDRSDRG
jgi:hypothetical protein